MIATTQPQRVEMIKVENLHKKFNDQKVLAGVNFGIKTGSVTSLMGRSGAGKSVLLRILIGLDKPDSGSVWIDGQNLVGLKLKQLNKVRVRFGVLFQEGALFDSLSISENVAFPLRERTKLSSSQIRELVDDHLEQVGLFNHGHKFPSELSGGMRKRAGLARALVTKPDIVFFDEPTSGLDPITKSTIYRLIEKTHAQREMTYVIISHDIKGVLDISNEIMVLNEGQIVARGNPEELSQSSDPLVQQFLTGSPDGPIKID